MKGFCPVIIPDTKVLQHVHGKLNQKTILLFHRKLKMLIKMAFFGPAVTLE